MKLPFKIFSISTIIAITLQGCVISDELIPDLEKNPNDSQTQAVDTTPPEVIEVTRIVYVDNPQADTSTDPIPTIDCETVCSDTDIESQLLEFSNTIGQVSNIFNWLKTASKDNAKSIKTTIDKVSSESPNIDSINLLYGIFHSLPKTGFRDTDSAIDYLNSYPKQSIENPAEATFFEFIVNHLKERKSLIDERSELRRQNSTLKKHNSEQTEIANRLNTQLRELKEIERSMIREQTQSKQYKVLK